jgi:hypothetical protein
MDRFGDYTPHGNTCIGETLDQLLNGHCNVQRIPNISVVQSNGNLRQSSLVVVSKSRGNCISEIDLCQ